MPPISRGFGGRPRRDVDPSRVPPGQYVVEDFPVLSAGPTPRTSLEQWSLTIDGAVDAARTWSWDQLRELPSETFTTDIHCVTKWTKLGTTWTGVSLDTLLEDVETEAEYLTAWCDGDYTTNLTIEDVSDGKAWIAYDFDGEPLDPEHGGPGAAARPAPVPVEEREVDPRHLVHAAGRAGLLGGRRLPQPRRPVAGAAVLERLTVARAPVVWRLARVRAVEEAAEAAVTIVLDVDDWPGHAAGQHVDVRLTAEDGYQAQRSYSIASAPEDPRLALTVERIDDGEVSPYLAGVAARGRRARGPRAGRRALHLAGAATAGRCCWWPAARGSCRCWRCCATGRRRAATSTRGCCSRRARGTTCSTATSSRRSATCDVHVTLTRAQPPGWSGSARRVDAEMLRELGPGPEERPRVYVCGPTAFVERAADLLVELGHHPAAIHAERFGPTGS